MGMAFNWATMRRKVRHSEVGVQDSAPQLAINEAPRNSYIRLGVWSISFQNVGVARLALPKEGAELRHSGHESDEAGGGKCDRWTVYDNDC